jgi:hypothetical protein
MGLDIYAVSHLKYVRPFSHEEREKLDEKLFAQGKDFCDLYVHVYENEHYPAQLEGMKLGLYELTDRSETYGFRAGAYSTYDWWREQLYTFVFPGPRDIYDFWADPESFAGQPFVEVLNFTDCDGRIGTRVAKKVAGDFASHEAKVASWVQTLEKDEAELFSENYHSFTKAFHLASQDGLLEFH